MNRMKVWRLANPEKAASSRRAREATPEHRAERKRVREENRVEIAATLRAYYAKNTAKICARSRGRYEANADAIRAQNAERSRVSPERNKAIKQRRRARLLDGCSPGVTPTQWLEIVETFDGRCAYCLRKGLPLEREHVIPLKRGGRDEPDNVVPACERCNCSKNASILPLWYARAINQKRI